MTDSCKQIKAQNTCVICWRSSGLKHYDATVLKSEKGTVMDTDSTQLLYVFRSLPLEYSWPWQLPLVDS